MRKGKGNNKNTKALGANIHQRGQLVMGKSSRKREGSVPSCCKVLGMTSSLGTPLTRADSSGLWTQEGFTSSATISVQETSSHLQDTREEYQMGEMSPRTGLPRYSKHHILRHTGKKKAEPESSSRKRFPNNPTLKKAHSRRMGAK